MTKISVKNINGEKVKDLTLTDSIWNIEVNEEQPVEGNTEEVVEENVEESAE